MRICSDLRTANNAICSIAHEVVGRIFSSVADVIRDAQFRVRINRRPSPNVAPPGFLLLWRHVLLLRANEFPDFVTLQASNAEIANVAVMVSSASVSQVHEKPSHCVLRNTSHADSGASRAPLDQAPNNLRATGCIQFVHTD